MNSSHMSSSATSPVLRTHGPHSSSLSIRRRQHSSAAGNPCERISPTVSSPPARSTSACTQSVRHTWTSRTSLGAGAPSPPSGTSTLTRGTPNSLGSAPLHTVPPRLHHPTPLSCCSSLKRTDPTA
ncbi:hypothetical protein K438DRAFT_1287748 [Mycena galopus ATCC 62051]|nr:hypothetical protein K438DRAFT_1287748 [Mycena galopus ATCC 62051]